MGEFKPSPPARKTDTPSWYVNRMNALLNLRGVLTNGEHHVAMVLCSHMNADGDAWMSVGTLAAESQRHPKTVRKLLAGIRKARVLVKDGRVRGGCPIYVKGTAFWGTPEPGTANHSHSTTAKRGTPLPRNAAPKDKGRNKEKETTPNPSRREGGSAVDDLTSAICSHLESWEPAPFPGLGDLERLLDGNTLVSVRSEAVQAHAADQQAAKPSGHLDPDSAADVDYWASVTGTTNRRRDREKLRQAMRAAAPSQKPRRRGEHPDAGPSKFPMQKIYGADYE